MAPSANAPFPTVAILGVGLIGGSIALAVRRAWPSVRIVGVDRPEVLDLARAAGAIDDGAGDMVAVRDARLIVLAAPVRQNIASLQQLAASVPGDTVVTDVGSTKGEILQAARGLSMAGAFVGGHPLAGSAEAGFGAARADLFVRQTWLLTTPAPEPVLQQLEAFIAGLHAVPVRIPADSHDAVLAYTSHLPQLVVSALLHTVGSAVGEPGLALAGPGLQDSTRLASSPYDIWKEIIATNAPEIGRALDAFIQALEQMRSGVRRIAPPGSEAPVLPDAPLAPEIERIFLSSARWKRALDFTAPKPAI